LTWAVEDEREDWGVYGWMMNGVGPVGWLVSLLLLLMVAAAVVVLVVFALRRPGTGGGAGPSIPPRSSAREILDERYARGEVEHDDYIRRRDELDRGSA
jgi:putative membrane protein